MIRPNINVVCNDGVESKLYPPLQWNECTSNYKMLTDCKEWLHSHQPSWVTATINLMYHHYTKSVKIKRGERLL